VAAAKGGAARVLRNESAGAGMALVLHVVGMRNHRGFGARVAVDTDGERRSGT
jgi:hypothetical protein